MAIFYKRWGVKTFTAAQVMLALDAANSMVEESAEQAQELAAAIGELADKPTDKLTAQGIGKLFQKHLKKRPVWIDNGKLIATLRVESKHQANRYTVEIRQPNGEAQASAEADDVGTVQDGGQASSSSIGEGTAQRKVRF